MATQLNPPICTTSIFTYDGTPKTVILTNFNSTRMQLLNGSATTAGTHIAMVALKDNTDTWSDTHDNKPKIYPYQINKSSNVVSVSENNVTLTLSRMYKDITIYRNGDGNLNVVSMNPEIATINQISTDTYRITAVNGGSTAIWIDVLEDANYTASTIEINVEVMLPDTILDNNTWEVISQISTNKLGPTFWQIGDTKKIRVNGNIGDTVTLDNVDMYVHILAFDHNLQFELPGITFGCFANPSGIGYKNVVLTDTTTGVQRNGLKCFNMNHWGTSSIPYNTNYGGWKGCDLRYDILGSTDVAPSGYGNVPTVNRVGYDPTSTCATNPVPNTLMAALPSDLRAVMKPTIKWQCQGGINATSTSQSNSYNSSKLEYSIDYLPLMSVYEVGSRTVDSVGINTAEGRHTTQYLYFQQSAYNVFGSYTDLTVSSSGNATNANGIITRSAGQYSDIFIIQGYVNTSGELPRASGTNSAYPRPLSPTFLV